MIQTNKNLKEYNTFGISVMAEMFAVFSSIEELKQILSFRNNKKLLVVGGGSNLLLTKDFDGLVIKNEIKRFEVIEETASEVIVESGAGENWHEFVLNCIDKGFGGIENLSLIPGSVGASPMQNIGAYGVEIKDVFESLSAYHIASGEIHYFDKTKCEFGYRESIFKNKVKGEYIILTVTFRLTKNPTINSSYGAINEQLKVMGIQVPTIKELSAAVIAIRQSKLPDPKIIGNAGSFFKNPTVEITLLEQIQKNYPDIPNYPALNGRKLAAGWLIEKAGWKGRTLGNYGVHKLQALVLVNYGNCTGQEIFDLSSQIIQDVFEKFGVLLEREVNIL
ncbi:MAG: UDP-N-acetylmuramate dehydrogenase [Flavobacteriia bacterium]|nr:UDP-N-acetylmuramate dehydrogenase [Flavobacteriia bacterium]